MEEWDFPLVVVHCAPNQDDGCLLLKIKNIHQLYSNDASKMKQNNSI